MANDERAANPPAKAHALDRTVTTLSELVAGIADASTGDYVRSAGRMLRAMRGRAFTQQFLREVEEFTKKGRIPPDYFDTDHGQTCLQEMLDVLDETGTDQRRFDVLKAVLFGSAIRGSDQDKILGQQYMRVARSLTSGDVLVLRAIRRRIPWTPPPRPDSNTYVMGPHASLWVEEIAALSGLKHRELVLQVETSLMEKGLITKRTESDMSGVKMTENDRLTELGIALCTFMRQYDEEKSERGAKQS